MVLEPAVTKPWQVYVRQIIKIIKNRDVIDKPKPLQVNASGIAEFIGERENKIVRPGHDQRLGQNAGPKVVLPQCGGGA